MLQEVGIHVLPGQYVKSFNGSNLGAVPDYASIPLLGAMTLPSDADLRAVGYSVPNEHSLPRLSKESLAFFDGEGVSVEMHYCFVDVDLPGHRPWESGELEDVLENLETLPEFSSAGMYQTEHGYRLVWRLDQPVLAKHYRSWSMQFFRHLSQYGIDVDPGCREWTRIYRLPHSTKDGSSSPLALYNATGPLCDGARLKWEPVGPLTEEHHAPHLALNFAPDPPSVVEPPPPESVKQLKSLPYYENLTKGRPLAKPGQRRHSIFSCAGMVAQALNTADPVLVYRIMLPAILADQTVTDAQGNPDPAPDQKVLWDACTFVARRQAAKLEENKEMHRALMRNMRNQTRAIVEQDEKRYEDDDSGEWREYTPETDAEISQRLILTDPSAKSFYILNEAKGTYEGPVGSPLIARTVDKCSPVLGSSRITTKNGAIRPVGDILRAVGTMVKNVVAVLGQPENRYNPVAGILYEGIAALRSDLQPAHHQDVHDWLTLLGGTNHDKLLDWLATTTDLTRPTCALYIEGEPGCGKGMLAGGVSRLYGGPPVNYAEFVGAFNGGITRSPIIWADEKMPASRYGETPTEVFRSLVGNSDFTLSRKFMPTTPVQGCLRLILTANNPDALGVGENLGPRDYEAVVRRIGYLRADPNTAAWLESRGGRTYTEDWVSGDKIAEHILWLRDNRTISLGARLLVEGWEEDFHRNLNLNLGVNHLVLETLSFMLANGVQDQDFFVGNGSLGVTLDAVKRNWHAAVGLHRDVPGRKYLRQALMNFAKCKARVKRSCDGTRVRVWTIDPQEVFRLASDYDMGDLADMQQRVTKPNAEWVLCENTAFPT